MSSETPPNKKKRTISPLSDWTDSPEGNPSWDHAQMGGGVIAEEAPAPEGTSLFSQFLHVLRPDPWEQAEAERLRVSRENAIRAEETRGMRRREVRQQAIELFFHGYRHRAPNNPESSRNTLYNALRGTPQGIPAPDLELFLSELRQGAREYEQRRNSALYFEQAGGDGPERNYIDAYGNIVIVDERLEDIDLGPFNDVDDDFFDF